MIIEPCCASKQLPKALFESPNRVLTFHTYGDVDTEKFYKSIACVMSDKHVMVLTAPNVNIATANFLRQCFSREWISDLVLTTHSNNAGLINSTLKDYLNHVSYVSSTYVTETSGQMILYTSPLIEAENPRQVLILNGYMPTIATKGNLTAYTLIFQPNVPDTFRGECGDHLRNAVIPLAGLHQVRRTLIAGKSTALSLFRDRQFLTNR